MKKSTADHRTGTSKKGFVLVTGASSGIGAELSRVFAENGYGLILTSRSSEKLEALAIELHTRFHSTVHVIPADLTMPDSAFTLFEKIIESGIEVDVLVNNAGAGCCGLFHEMEMRRIGEMLKLDVEALTCLARLFAEEMVRRGNGRILNVASTGSYQPGPYISVYYAAKAYVLSLSHAMAEELGSKGVVVSALCPGATRTGFARAAGKADMGMAMDPAVVAQTAYKGLMKGRRVIIPGMGNKVAVFFTKLLPGRINAIIVKNIQRKMINSL